jgi:dolichol-phosphate mannosyltransferase
MDLSMVLATYNEKENIEDMITKIDQTCRKSRISTEIIVVDDNSPDGTADVVKKMMKKNKNVRLIVRQKREGLCPALFQGYKAAKGNIIGSSDADLSIDPKYIPQFYRKIQEGFDLVVGSKHMKGGKIVGKPAYTTIISKGSALMASIFFRMNLHDYNLNFRFFKKAVLPKKLTSKGNVQFAEFIYRAKRKGFKITELPITFVERLRGKSKFKIFRQTFYYLIGLLKITLFSTD